MIIYKQWPIQIPLLSKRDFKLAFLVNFTLIEKVGFMLPIDFFNELANSEVSALY